MKFNMQKEKFAEFYFENDILYIYIYIRQNISYFIRFEIQ